MRDNDGTLQSERIECDWSVRDPESLAHKEYRECRAVQHPGSVMAL